MRSKTSLLSLLLISTSAYLAESLSGKSNEQRRTSESDGITDEFGSIDSTIDDENKDKQRRRLMGRRDKRRQLKSGKGSDYYTNQRQLKANKFRGGSPYEAPSSTFTVDKEDCPFPAPPISTTIGMKVEKVGSIPVVSTAPFQYNLYPGQTAMFGNLNFFIDQKYSTIHAYNNDDGTVTKVFDGILDELPSGIDLTWTYPWAGGNQQIMTISPGSDKDELIVVFGSSALPDGWTVADATMPGPTSRRGCSGMIDDIYHIDPIPDCFGFGGGWTTLTSYFVFTKYKFDKSQMTFSNPDPFFVAENQVMFGHSGGGILLVDDHYLLYGTGDCLPYGLDGDVAPQDDDGVCGKILLIDTKVKGEHKVVAKGIRNAQQFQKFVSKEDGEEYLAFSDVGGVTREEVNAVKLKDLLNINKTKKNVDVVDLKADLDCHQPLDVVDLKAVNPSLNGKPGHDEIPNFGWGIDSDIVVDGIQMGREGSMVVGNGTAGILGTEPACFDEAPDDDAKKTKPWIEFNRQSASSFWAISGMMPNSPQCIDDDSFEFVYTNKKGVSKVKGGCEHVAKKKKKRCRKIMNDGIKVAKSCPVACSKCEEQPLKVWNELSLFWTEMNSGTPYGTLESYHDRVKNGGESSDIFTIPLYDSDGKLLENGFNDLVAIDTANTDTPQDVGRGDPRPFLYADGTPGIFIERTGVFYKLEDFSLRRPSGNGTNIP